MSNYEQTKEIIREYLIKSKFNRVSEIISGSSKDGFMCEALTENRRFTLFFLFHEVSDLLTVDVYSGITIPNEYEYKANSICKKANNSFKCGYIGLNEQNEVYSHMSAFFKDSPISEVTLKELECICIATLELYSEEFLSIIGNKNSEKYESIEDILNSRLISTDFSNDDFQIPYEQTDDGEFC